MIRDEYFSRRRYAFDTETTGVNVHSDRIVTAALWGFGGGKEPTFKKWVINPGIPIPTEASEIHGITDEIAVRDGQEPDLALAEIASSIEAIQRGRFPIVAFNLAFDWSILKADLKRQNVSSSLEYEYERLIDPYVLDKAADQYRRGSRKLGTLCQHYGVELDNWHSADADAQAAGMLADVLMRKVLWREWKEFYESQKYLRERQCLSLQGYFRRTGKPDAVVDGGWPLLGSGGVK